MTVPRVDDPNDQFPIGMRVLAVDDDPTCLLLLETLLRRCKYHVTTTNQAVIALKMLRENKNKFDLVISDVHMPDMDGFRLLELVGLEMDLPVIMLSANGDPKLVMKGITHGACDYLLKPVRIEELKNIWQHVIRRKKFDRNDRNNLENCDKSHNSTGESPGKGSHEGSVKLNRKRKDQDEDEDEEHDESGHDNEDPSTQKKPRVVWSVELHRKFVAAVNQLGIDKAVPKKILELMNVERLTRENVASHLQKYRLYLKRISSVANQQANMMAALGNANTPYLRINSMGGSGTFFSSAGSGQFQNTALNSLQHNGMLGRLNTPSLSPHGLPYSGAIQLGHSQNYSNCTKDQGKLQQILPEKNGGTILQGLPASLEVDELQCHNGGKGITQVGESSDIFNSTTGFPISRSFPDVKNAMSSLSNLQYGALNNLLIPEYHIQGGNKFGTQSTVVMGSNPTFSSHLTGLGCGNDNWLDAAHLSRVQLDKCSGSWPTSSQSPVVQMSSLPSIDGVRQSTSHQGSSGGNMTAVALGIGSNLCNVSSISSSSQLPNSTVDVPYQRASLCGNPMSTDLVSSQGWDEHDHGSLYKTNMPCSSVNPSISLNDTLGSLGHTLEPQNMTYDRNTDFNLTGGQEKCQGRQVGNSIGSLEDIVNVLMKEE